MMIDITTLRRARDDLRVCFEKHSETESISISPAPELSDTLAFTGLLYHEILQGRILQIQIDPEMGEQVAREFDYWFSSFLLDGENHRFLAIDLKSIPHDYSGLWHVRNAWLHSLVNEKEMSILLKNIRLGTS